MIAWSSRISRKPHFLGLSRECWGVARRVRWRLLVLVAIDFQSTTMLGRCYLMCCFNLDHEEFGEPTPSYSARKVGDEYSRFTLRMPRLTLRIKFRVLFQELGVLASTPELDWAAHLDQLRVVRLGKKFDVLLYLLSDELTSRHRLDPYSQ